MASGPGGLFKAVEVSTLGATKQSLSSEMSQVMLYLISWLDFTFTSSYWIEFFSRSLKFHQMIKGINGSMVLMINLAWVVEVMKENETKRQHWGESVKAVSRATTRHLAFCSGWKSGSVQVLCHLLGFYWFTVCFRVPLHLTFSSTMPHVHIMKSIQNHKLSQLKSILLELCKSNFIFTYFYFSII